MSIADLRAKLGYSEGEIVAQTEPEKPASERPRVIWRDQRLCELTASDRAATS